VAKSDALINEPKPCYQWPLDLSMCPYLGNEDANIGVEYSTRPSDKSADDDEYSEMDIQVGDECYCIMCSAFVY